jgi:hypothetical protein
MQNIWKVYPKATVVEIYAWIGCDGGLYINFSRTKVLNSKGDFIVGSNLQGAIFNYTLEENQAFISLLLDRANVAEATIVIDARCLIENDSE